MKTLIKINQVLVLLILLLPFDAAEAQRLEGYVLQHSSGLKGVGGVGLRPIVGKATETRSDKERGYYRLDFTDKKVGQLVSLRAEKKDWIVVNPSDTANVVLPEAGIFKSIVMCPADEIPKKEARLLADYGKKLKKEFEKEKNRLIASITQRAETDNGRLKDSLSNLQKQYEQLKFDAPQLAHSFARENTDFMSDLRRRAFEAFQKGNFALAQSILNTDSLDRDNRLADEKISRARRDLTEGENDKRNVIRGWLEKAQYNRADFQLDSATFSYERAVAASDSSLDILNEYTEFLRTTGNIERAAQLNAAARARAFKGFSSADSSQYTEGYAVALFRAMNIASDQTNNADALRWGLTALPICQRLATQNVDYQLTVGQILKLLGFINMRLGNQLQAIELDKQAAAQLDKSPTAAQVDIYLLEKSNVFTNMSRALIELSRFDSALSSARRGLEIKQQLFRKDSLTYAVWVGIGFNTLGKVYFVQNKFSEAITAYLASIRYCRVAARSNPTWSDQETVRSRDNVIDAYINSSNFDLAEQYLTEQQTLLRLNFGSNPSFYRRIQSSIVDQQKRLFEKKQKKN